MQVCLYGASSTETDAALVAATERLGELLAEAGHTLVYGGGGAGLMGAAARGMKRKGGCVVGIVPSFLRVDGVLYDGCDEMVYTDTMRERKQQMEERADAFIVTPGGIGTFEEFFEIYTLKQLGRHHKPLIIFNIDGYYDAMLAMLQHTVDAKLMRPETLSLLSIATTPEGVLALLEVDESASVDIKKTKYV